MAGQLTLIHDLQATDSTEQKTNESLVNIRNSFVLVITAEKFSEQVGLPVGVVIGWVKKGYLPVKRIGKYTLINLALLNQELLI